MVYKPPAAEKEEPPAPEPGLEPEPPRLRIGSEEYELDRTRVLLGRSRECDIRLSDPNVSRRHAEVRRENGSYWVIDLDSTNGTEVNGRRLRRARLSTGDVIRIGETDLRFEK